MNSSTPLYLTERQKQIGICLLSGMSIKVIAQQFKLSIRTVRAHQNGIRKKLACQNAYQVGYKLALLLDVAEENKTFIFKNSVFKVTHVTFANSAAENGLGMMICTQEVS